MLGTRICLVPISCDKRVPDYSQRVQREINPFLFLDIINIPSIVLFAKEMRNFPWSSPQYRSLKKRIFYIKGCIQHHPKVCIY